MLKRHLIRTSLIFPLMIVGAQINWLFGLVFGFVLGNIILYRIYGRDWMADKDNTKDKND